jgi:hypothetical protein
MRDENLPRCQWKLGRITRAIKSNDGFVRKVELLTTESNNGRKARVTLERPIHKLVTLLENCRQ